MSLQVIVPAYGDDPLRLRNLGAVLNHLTREDLDASSFVLPDDIASPGAARNLSARMTYSGIVVFNDADSIVPGNQIRHAARLASIAPGLVFAYDLYCRVGKNTTALYARKPDFPLAAERVIHSSGSMGCVAIRRECFDALGGFDEAYVGWGYEDLDFARRAGARWPLRRVSGPLFHLWHGERREDDSPLDSDEAQAVANAELFASRPAR
jgi:hypothetical protein